MRGKGPNKIPTHKGARITPAYAGKRLPLLDYSPACWDHPRVCGEKNCLQLRITEAMGSPPRMRGKVTPSRCSWACIGITPAYAGKSPTAKQRGIPGRDHPRVCGEKPAHAQKLSHCEGSPPRMRGKGGQRVAKRTSLGITPAYAGKRKEPTGAPAGRRDHPRVCGEKPAVDGKKNPCRGSPPRMRGKD